MKRIAIALAVIVAVALQLRPHDGMGAAPATVPDAVREAAEQGRYWRASRLLEDHLETVTDTAPATILFAARMDAGWAHWPGVVRLLDGRSWLDQEGGGEGWALLGRARMAEGEMAAGARALRAYVQAGGADAEARGVAELRRGLALSRLVAPDTAVDLEAALEAFDRAGRALPWFGDWVHFFAARAAARAGDIEETERRLAAARGTGAGPWRIRAMAALVAGDTMAARESALAATRTGSRADRTEAWAELGRLRLAAGDTARGKYALGRAMEARGTVGAVNAARRMSELDPTPGEWRTIARVYQWHGNARRAAEGYERFLAGDAGTPGERIQARLDLGRARFDAGRFRQAERELLALAAEDVSDRVAAEALYVAARAQYRTGRAGAGQATFDRLAAAFPDQEAVTRGLYLVADLKHDDLATDGPGGARAYYRRAADAVPELNEAGLALMRLAGLEYLDGNYAGAVAIWEEYRSLHPNGRRIAQATYWAARGYRALGRDSLADARLRDVRRVDPVSFYGVRAAELLGQDVLAFDMAPAPAADTVGEDLVADIEAGLRRVDLLADLDRRDDLVHEVEGLRRRYQSSSAPWGVVGEYALAEALNARGYTLTGIGMGWTLYERTGEWNPRLLRIIFPFPYRNLVVPEAEERGLDPYLMAGLIRRESAFNPVVVSGAGAIGLMQIVPETGRQLARGVGLRDFTSELLTRPEVNVVLGTRFFAQLMDRFGEGDLPLVLSAYNAGPTRANVWRRMPEAEAGDPELFTERIPYGETRDYVRNVLLHQALYRALYPDLGPDPAPDSNDDDPAPAP